MSYTPNKLNQEIGNDAGGRTRVSTLSTLFDGKILGADDLLIWENTGTGSFTYTDNKINMQVGAGQYAIRRSKNYLPYFSGKSQIIETTADNMQAEAGVSKLMGYYSSSPVAPYNTIYDGFWIEQTSTDIKLKVQRNGTVNLDLSWTLWDNYEAISDYNWANFTVVLWDFLWLGGTELRVFLKTTKGFILVHTFKWASTQPDLFISSPSQTVRYEIRSTSGAGSMRSICSAVATEGDVSGVSKSLALYSPTAVTTNTIGVLYALKGIKKNPAFRYSNIQVSSFGVVNTGSSDQGIIMLIANPTLSSALTYNAKSRLLEANATNQTIVSGTGRVLAADPAGTSGSSDSLSANFLSNIGISISDVSDEYVLAYMPATTNQSVFGTIAVKES